MFDAEDAGFNLFRGRIVTPQGIIDGTVEVEGGRIIAVRAGQRAGRRRPLSTRRAARRRGWPSLRAAPR